MSYHLPTQNLGPDLLDGEPKPLRSRGISQETCKRWGYTVAKDDNGKFVQVATYYDTNGTPIAQKIRTRDKKHFWRGKKSQAGLYGMHLSRGTRRIIITEGELDALSCSQVLNYRWPVVSLPDGAHSAKEALSKHLEWLLKFEEIVLCFDMDEAGRGAAEQCAALFPPGRVSLVHLPEKDASDMLQQGRVEELVGALWGAKAYRPDGVITVEDVWDEVLEEPDWGLPWFLEDLNERTYGRRYGEAVALGAGTGVGKTTFITQQVAEDIKNGHKVGLFFFEQLPKETFKRLAGMLNKRIYHVPGSDTSGLPEGMAQMKDAVHVYDHFGACEWDVVKERIRYLAHAQGIRLFYLDHLTALAQAEPDEREGLERIMAEIGRLVKELNIWLLFVSHLATPEGTPHEEGGRVKIRHFKGSRSIGFWSHFMFGIERDQQGEDEGLGGDVSVLRCLKDRYTGHATGLCIDMEYDKETGVFLQGKF